MKIKAYEAYFVQPGGRKLEVKKPAVYLTKTHLIDKIMWGKSFEFMYFVLPDCMDEIAFDKIILHIARYEFDKNPKSGLLCYKNGKGKLSFKQFYKTTAK